MQVQALVITAFAVAVVALSARMRTQMAEAFPADDEGRPGDMRSLTAGYQLTFDEEGALATACC